VISTNVPDLVTLAQYRRAERWARQNAADPDSPPPEQPPADDVQWTTDDLVTVAALKSQYAAASPDLQALMRVVHSHDTLTRPERSAALRAIGQTTVTQDMCAWCRTMPSLPHVGVCKFHASRAISVRA